jgi:flagellar basal-body rod protein FlgB
MAIPDLPILSMLRTRMQWHQERQRVLAENVANAERPVTAPAIWRRRTSRARCNGCRSA